MIYSVSCGHHDPFRFARDPDTALIQELDVLSHPPPGPSRMSEAHFYCGAGPAVERIKGQQFSIANLGLRTHEFHGKGEAALRR